MLKKLTSNNRENFFSDVEVAEVFTYSDFFLVDDIRFLANEQGVVVEYCPPQSDEYIKHGCQTMVVTIVRKDKFMNAAEARIHAAQVNTKKDKEQFDSIKTEIAGAVANGLFETRRFGMIRPSVMILLNEAGYVVTKATSRPNEIEWDIKW